MYPEVSFLFSIVRQICLCPIDCWVMRLTDIFCIIQGLKGENCCSWMFFIYILHVEASFGFLPFVFGFGFVQNKTSSDPWYAVNSVVVYHGSIWYLDNMVLQPANQNSLNYCIGQSQRLGPPIGKERLWKPEMSKYLPPSIFWKRGIRYFFCKFYWIQTIMASLLA